MIKYLNLLNGNLKGKIQTGPWVRKGADSLYFNANSGFRETLSK